jgi:hypothetical protein
MVSMGKLVAQICRRVRQIENPGEIARNKQVKIGTCKKS